MHANEDLISRDRTGGLAKPEAKLALDLLESWLTINRMAQVISVAEEPDSPSTIEPGLVEQATAEVVARLVPLDLIVAYEPALVTACRLAELALRADCLVQRIDVMEARQREIETLVGSLREYGERMAKMIEMLAAVSTALGAGMGALAEGWHEPSDRTPGEDRRR